MVGNKYIGWRGGGSCSRCLWTSIRPRCRKYCLSFRVIFSPGLSPSPGRRTARELCQVHGLGVEAGRNTNREGIRNWTRRRSGKRDDGETDFNFLYLPWGLSVRKFHKSLFGDQTVLCADQTFSNILNSHSWARFKFSTSNSLSRLCLRAAPHSMMPTLKGVD